MWLVTGPFDGVEQGDTTSTKTKLMKPGKKYGLGRKDRPLIVNNKKISRDTCEFRVGPYAPDNTIDPSYIPTLEIFNNKDKSLAVKRQGEDVMCNPSASITLEDGDLITVIAGIMLEVRWQRIACYVPPVRGMPSFSSKDCASVGITILSSAHGLLTHHLTSKYEVSTPVMTSMLCAAQLVKPEWLQELVRIGNTPVENDPFGLTVFEKSFAPPLETKYRPAFGSALPPALKSFKHWEPNEERLNLLRGFRFILLAEDGEVDAELRELVVRGGAEYEGFNLNAGLAKWRQVIAKGKRKVEELGVVGKRLVVLAKDSVIQRAVEEEKWKEMVADAESLSVSVLQPETVLGAVVHVDASRIAPSGGGSQASLSGSSPLPSFVPNTHPDEPSLSYGSDKHIFTEEVQRGVSPVSGKNNLAMRSQSPSPVVPEAPPTQLKRKPLVRRLPIVMPVETDEGSAMNVDAHESDNRPEPSQAPKPPSGGRPRLKRRLGLPAALPEIHVVTIDEVVDEEPPHKRFKALFEASDPDKGLVQGSQAFEAAHNVNNAVGTLGESVTQTGQSVGVAPPTRLPVVAEEEESLSFSGPSQRAKSVAVEEPPMINDVRPSSQVPAVQARAKSKAPPSRQLSEPPRTKVKQKKATDNDNHAVDKDEAFLTAVASKKRGKKAEDNFDREFNKLRISKPDLQGEDEQAWAVLGDFDDIPNIRGNFMVVMDLDVFKSSNGRREMATNDAHNPAFINRPNFKKFKKKVNGFYRAPIELVVKEENDYGMGAGYWKDTVSTKDYTKDSQAIDNGTQRSKPRALAAMDSDEDTRVQTLDTVKQSTRKRARAANAKNLFLVSDDDVKDDTGVAADSSEGPPPAASTPAARARVSKRRRVVADDDSDDGVAFKGFGKKKRAK